MQFHKKQKKHREFLDSFVKVFIQQHNKEHLCCCILAGSLLWYFSGKIPLAIISTAANKLKRIKLRDLGDFYAQNPDNSEKTPEHNDSIISFDLLGWYSVIEFTQKDTSKWTSFFFFLKPSPHIRCAALPTSMARSCARSCSRPVPWRKELWEFSQWNYPPPRKLTCPPKKGPI